MPSNSSSETSIEENKTRNKSFLQDKIFLSSGVKNIFSQYARETVNGAIRNIQRINSSEIREKLDKANERLLKTAKMFYSDKFESKLSTSESNTSFSSIAESDEVFLEDELVIIDPQSKSSELNLKHSNLSIDQAKSTISCAGKTDSKITTENKSYNKKKTKVTLTKKRICKTPGCDGKGNTKGGKRHFTVKNCPYKNFNKKCDSNLKSQMDYKEELEKQYRKEFENLTV